MACIETSNKSIDSVIYSICQRCQLKVKCWVDKMADGDYPNLAINLND
jgi:hypothetical protein